MSTVSAYRWMAGLLAATALTSLGNAVLTWRLATRLAALEAPQAASQPLSMGDESMRAKDAAIVASGAHGAYGDTGALLIRDASGALPGPPPSLEQKKVQIDPAKAANDMDRLLALEPALPAVEQAHLQALQQAIQRMPADVAQPVGMQTDCRGRRCLLSAGFTDDLQANEWAQRLMLLGGKNMPRAARIIAVPLQDGSGAVNLQLYLF